MNKKPYYIYIYLFIWSERGVDEFEGSQDNILGSPRLKKLCYQYLKQMVDNCL